MACLKAWASASGHIRGGGTFMEWRPVLGFGGVPLKEMWGASAAASLLLCFPTGRQTACHLLRCAASQQAPNNEGNKSCSPPTLNLIKPFLLSRWLPRVFLPATESWLIHPYLLYEPEVNGNRITTKTVRTKKLNTAILKIWIFYLYNIPLVHGSGGGVP